MNDSGFVKLRKLTDNEIVSTRRKAGVIERYLSLMPEDNASLQDIDLDPAEMFEPPRQTGKRRKPKGQEKSRTL